MRTLLVIGIILMVFVSGALFGAQKGNEREAVNDPHPPHLTEQAAEREKPSSKKEQSDQTKEECAEPARASAAPWSVKTAQSLGSGVSGVFNGVIVTFSSFIHSS
ncbi:hypothetical protein [Thalassobacillus sp. CUG 92003]|uniref:hypothetical protein n=1 Tax=Thalassobacillus sp. CUG 92003 TaxID=2736641 RepID=UPI0015E7E2E3|nr:hypothetical protein [Thalassobacillus sp. CUG 92003]